MNERMVGFCKGGVEFRGSENKPAIQSWFYQFFLIHRVVHFNICHMFCELLTVYKCKGQKFDKPSSLFYRHDSAVPAFIPKEGSSGSPL